MIFNIWEKKILHLTLFSMNCERRGEKEEQKGLTFCLILFSCHTFDFFVKNRDIKVTTEQIVL
jgi:hypothetical protein